MDRSVKERHRGSLSRRRMAQGVGMLAGYAAFGREVLAAMATPGQVEGPFHPIEKQSDTDLDLVWIEGHAKPAMGEVILVQGRVLDRSGNPLADALVDVWQANHHGRYAHPEDPNTAPLDPDFQGWGLIRTDASGGYRFRTIRPGAYPLSFLGEEGWRCRHIHFQVSHPSVRRLTTQMYFEGDPLIGQDQEIAKVPEDQRHLLITKAEQDPATGLPLHTFDVVLDG